MTCLRILVAAAMLAATAAASAQTVSASALLGAEVLHASGGEAGYIADLAVNLSESRIHYAMVHGKAPRDEGTRKRTYGVPLESLAPGVRRNTLTLETPQASPAVSTDVRLMRASSLLGKQVLSPSGAELGVIADLAIDLETAAVVHVLLKGSASKRDESRRSEVPLRALRFPALGGDAILRARAP